MMENTRTTYSPEEKMEIVLAILTKKTTIQQVSQSRGIAPTLISLWKKQALEAMSARLQPQPKGRRKKLVPEVGVSADAEVKSARNEARAAKIRAAHLENSLRETRDKLAKMEAQLVPLAALVGCVLMKERKPRAPRKPRKA